MIEFIRTWSQVLLLTLKYRQYSVVAGLHTFQFTVAHSLGFPVFIARLLATDLNTETINSLSESYTPGFTL
jgi:hypothetical protein